MPEPTLRPTVDVTVNGHYELGSPTDATVTEYDGGQRGHVSVRLGGEDGPNITLAGPLTDVHRLIITAELALSALYDR